MAYRMVAVPENKLDELPEGSDLLEYKSGTGPTGQLVKEVDTEFGPLTLHIYEGEDGMRVNAHLPDESFWVVNGIPVSGYYVVNVRHERIEYGILSREDKDFGNGYDQATDSAKSKVRQVCIDALEQVSDSELQEALIRSRQSRRFTVMNSVARKAEELAGEYNRVEEWA